MNLTLRLKPCVVTFKLKELRHDILSHFLDGPRHSLSVGKPKTKGLLMKEKNQRGDSKAKRNEDG